MSRGPDARRAAEKAGRRGEGRAAFAYLIRGYELLDRRFRAGGGEIDLVLRRGDTLVFVEVKTRKDADAAIFAVTPRNRLRLEEAGRSWIAKNPKYQAFALRYDIAAVSGFSVRLVKDAWRSSR